MLKTTLGSLLVNEALPVEFRDYQRVLDKKGMAALLRDVAQKDPEQYRLVSKKLADIGRRVATESGGNSFSLAHMGKAKAGLKYQQHIREQMKVILANDDLTDDQRHDMILRMVGRGQEKQMDDILAESLQENNPLALQVLSGSRGNKMNLASLRGSDLLYADHRDRVVPLPVNHSYSEGLKPIEYWAGTYGARKGVLATKFAVQQSGFLSKQLNQVAHRLMVVDEDDPRDMTGRGMPVDTDDADSEGSLLAHDVGGYKRNTVLTPKILSHLKSMGQDRILIRSPIIGGSPDGGVYARDVGVREFGTLPGRGSQVGFTAAQALSEPISQGTLSTKHSGGVAGQEKTVSGFAAIDQQIQVPSTFRGGAAHAELDGMVDRIADAPAGGKFVWIDGKEHYVAQGFKINVKPGQKVEAGDRISEGAANPSLITQHKGIGEARRAFAYSLREAMQDAGMKANRRNVELLARGLINHVRLTDEFAGHLPDDVIPYSTLEHLYEPREGSETVQPSRALGRYLEKPVLHYTIGTKVRPSVLKDLKHFGVKDITVHREEPPFQPEMIRGMMALQHDPDPFTRMYGSGLKKSLLDAAQSGRTSDEASTSFVPSLMRGVDFGRVGPIRQPRPGTVPAATTAALPPASSPPSPVPPRISPTTVNTAPEAAAMPRKKVVSPALDLSAPPPAPRTFFGGIGLMFKSSIDQVAQMQEAKALMEKVARQAQPVQQARPVRLCQPALQIKTATPGTLRPPALPRQPLAPPQQRPPQAPHRPLQALPQQPAAPVPPQRPQPPGAPQPPVPRPPAGATMRAFQAPQSTPNQVHPARASGQGTPWRGAPWHAPNVAATDYSHGGLASNMDSPEQVAQFVAGRNPDDFLGMAGRFGSALNMNAMYALTSGDQYVRNRSQQGSGDGMNESDQADGDGAQPGPRGATWEQMMQWHNQQRGEPQEFGPRAPDAPLPSSEGPPPEAQATPAPPRYTDPPDAQSVLHRPHAIANRIGESALIGSLPVAAAGGLLGLPSRLPAWMASRLPAALTNPAGPLAATGRFLGPWASRAGTAGASILSGLDAANVIRGSISGPGRHEVGLQAGEDVRAGLFNPPQVEGNGPVASVVNPLSAGLNAALSTWGQVYRPASNIATIAAGNTEVERMRRATLDARRSQHGTLAAEQRRAEQVAQNQPPPNPNALWRDPLTGLPPEPSLTTTRVPGNRDANRNIDRLMTDTSLGQSGNAASFLGSLVTAALDATTGNRLQADEFSRVRLPAWRRWAEAAMPQLQQRINTQLNAAPADTRAAFINSLSGPQARQGALDQLNSIMALRPQEQQALAALPQAQRESQMREFQYSRLAPGQRQLHQLLTMQLHLDHTRNQYESTTSAQHPEALPAAPDPRWAGFMGPPTPGGLPPVGHIPPPPPPSVPRSQTSASAGGWRPVRQATLPPRPPAAYRYANEPRLPGDRRPVLPGSRPVPPEQTGGDY